MTETKKKLIEAAISLINEAIDTKTSLNKLCVQKGRVRNFIANMVWEYKESEVPSSDNQDDIILIQTFLTIYDKYLSLKQTLSNEHKSLDKPELIKENRLDKSSFLVDYDAYTDDSYDDLFKGEMVRNGEEFTLSDGKTVMNKISEYSYRIKIRNKPDLIGSLSREEMETIYRSYSNLYGAGLTRRAVSRMFPTIDYDDFIRILRAFNITKTSHPVAPHTIEESSTDEIAKIIYTNKEHDVLKKLDQESGKVTAKNLSDAQKEILRLKKLIHGWETMGNQLILNDIIPFEITKKETKSDNALIVYLSDMHVGAQTLDESIYENTYNSEEFNKRLRATCDEITRQYEIFGRFDKVIICNLGDSLDGYNAQTTRGGHKLPQNMTNKEQFEIFVKGMLSFFETLHNIDVANSIDYICVGDSNHDGDFGWAANKTIETYLNQRYPGMNARVFNKFIEYFKYGVHTFILTHGKDKEDKAYGFPLTLNDKTEVYINEYLHNNNINSEYTHVISGDLHQTCIGYAKRFRYKKVSSLYGSSKWIHTNFGNTKAAVDFEIVPKDNGIILEGRLTLV
jgi:hypothetical protein